MKKTFVISACLALCLCTAETVTGQPVHWTANGHYYELVRTNVITWFDARAEAGTRSHSGFPGHLATITSQAENDFITNNFSTNIAAQFVWLGGRAPNDQVDGLWRWDAGPETSVQFSHYAMPTQPFHYANWGGIEPNHNAQGEDFLDMNVGLEFAGISTGQWADAVARPNPADPVVGYIIEYEPAVAPATNYLIIRRVLEAYELSFFAETNKTYQIEYSLQIPVTNWFDLNPTVVGSGAAVSLFDSTSDPVRFYRLRIQ